MFLEEFSSTFRISWFYHGRLELWAKRGRECLSLVFWELASQLDLCPQAPLGNPRNSTKMLSTCLIINVVFNQADCVCGILLVIAQGHSSCALVQGWGGEWPHNCFIRILWKNLISQGFHLSLQSLFDTMFLSSPGAKYCQNIRF